MQRTVNGGAGWSGRILLFVGAILLTGCQTWTSGMTLPSGHYLEHPPQYIPSSPPYPLTRELSRQEERAVAVPPGATQADLPHVAGPSGPTWSDPPRAATAAERDASASKEWEEALQEHAEALAALKVATRALEASQKRLEALAKKEVAGSPTVGAPGTPTSLPAPPPVAIPAAPGAR